MCCLSSCSYIKPQHMMQALIRVMCCLSSCSYIKPQLDLLTQKDFASCLSSCSYIKPQHVARSIKSFSVVYHLVPTSNHNRRRIQRYRRELFIILFLHQTTTGYCTRTYWTWLFIILFLHQTTTEKRYRRRYRSCLSSCSYIKPQRTGEANDRCIVVYHLVPTSNHNL